MDFERKKGKLKRELLKWIERRKVKEKEDIEWFDVEET
jgi:hypothetical protein